MFSIDIFSGLSNFNVYIFFVVLKQQTGRNSVKFITNSVSSLGTVLGKINFGQNGDRYLLCEKGSPTIARNERVNPGLLYYLNRIGLWNRMEFPSQNFG